MSYTVARYILWILLTVPVAILGLGLCWNLIDNILQESRERKAKKEAEKAKAQKRDYFEQEYRKSRESGL